LRSTEIICRSDSWKASVFTNLPRSRRSTLPVNDVLASFDSPDIPSIVNPGYDWWLKLKTTHVCIIVLQLAYAEILQKQEVKTKRSGEACGEKRKRYHMFHYMDSESEATHHIQNQMNQKS
jgi:hypothetical protein